MEEEHKCQGHRRQFDNERRGRIGYVKMEAEIEERFEDSTILA